jgi:hypothetical protein
MTINRSGVPMMDATKNDGSSFSGERRAAIIQEECMKPSSKVASIAIRINPIRHFPTDTGG